MAKGKQSLKEKLGEDLITQTDEESGNIPFFLIDDNYGVAVNPMEYLLVERKEKTRSIKDDTGNVIGGETYYSWEFCRGSDTFETSLINYTKLTERKLLSTLVKCKDFRILVKIRLQIQKTINDAFKIDGLNKELLNACTTIESPEELNLKMKEMMKLMDDAQIKYDDFIEFLKEKQRIVVHRTEPVKRRLNLEKE